MRKGYIWLFGGVLALGIVGGGMSVLRRGPKPTPVQVAKVERQDVQAKVTANGKVQAQKKVDISATIAGQITQLAVNEGDAVKKGQFLLQLDPVGPRAQARSSEFSMQALLQEQASAEANLRLAEDEFRRADENHKAQIISASDYQRARTTLATAEANAAATRRRVQQARASLEAASDLLAKTTVRSPIDGIVTARRVEEGEVAVIGVQNSPGTVLLTISDMSVVETEMEVDEASIPSVKLGQEAVIRIDAYPNQTFQGVVTEVGSSPITATTGAQQTQATKFKVKIQIKNPPEGIKPGLSAQADILTGFAPDALVVPIQALVVRDAPREDGKPAEAGAPREQEGVYLLDGGKVEFHPIETGLMGELMIEVKSGLNGGETVVTGPFQALRSLKPGDLARAEEPKKGEGQPG
ncbi:MAG: efflux RND transporter periplasmic adaptor subunit [Acidobacteria bacterium]|nr:efflux RND transporter periplasmic adaptor subunit [Acidobacteriota bacterium]